MNKIMRFLKKSKKGFTLIEVLTTISILGILTLTAMPNYSSYVHNAKIAQIKADIKTSEDFIEAAKVIGGIYEEDKEIVEPETLYSYVENEQLYGKEGIVKEEDFDKNLTYKKLDKNYQVHTSSFINTSLNGSFVIDSNLEVYYVEDKVKTVPVEESTANMTEQQKEDKIIDKIDFSKVVADSTTEGLFTTLSNASSPVIIGDELFALSYFDPSSIYVYDLETKKQKRVMKNYTSYQNVLSSPNMKRFYSLGSDGEHLLAFRTSTSVDIIDKDTGKYIETRNLKSAMLDYQNSLMGSSSFFVRDGLLYAGPFYTNEIKIFDFNTGDLLKTVPGFKGITGVTVRGNTLFAVERDLKRLTVLDISDKLNPVKKSQVDFKNSYDILGVGVDSKYIYIATYQSHKIVRYPIGDFAK